nr:hypothetical protein [Tanacetum cinerariifolium]
MAGPIAGNQIAKRVIGDLIDLSRETYVRKNLLAQLNVLIAELEASADPDEVFDILFCLRDDVHAEQARFGDWNDCITQAKVQIENKEDHVRVMKAKPMMVRAGLGFFCVVLYGLCLFSLLFSIMVVFAFIVRVYHPAPMVLGIVCKCYRLEFGEGSSFFLDKLSEVAESPSLGDKIKYVFGCSRSEDKSLGSLMRNLCSALRVLVSYKQRLVAELEALVEVEGAAKSLEHMRAIVGRDAVTLGGLKHCGHVLRLNILCFKCLLLCFVSIVRVLSVNLGELHTTFESVYWEQKLILFYHRSVDEDYRPGRQINRVAAVVHNMEIQLKDQENISQMHLLEREIELNASKKELFIKKLDGLVPY